MRCFWKLFVVLAVLPVFSVGCGPAYMDDNVTQEEVDAEAAEAVSEESSEESEGTGDESDDSGSEEAEE